MAKAKEVPSFTKPLGGGAPNGAERTEGAYRRDKPASREHQFKNTGPGKGYGNVGKAGTNSTDYPDAASTGGERQEGMIRGDKSVREHQFKNTGAGAGYNNVGKSAKTGNAGAERTEGAYKKKPYTR
jgi:hypothetical protein